jgi:hypothetical protein
MGGPWEDFAKPAEEGPWADFAPKPTPAVPVASAATEPWQDFATPGITDYLTQTGAAVGRGAVESGIVAPLQGLAGISSTPELSAREKAFDILMKGGDLADPAVMRVAQSDELPRGANVTEHPLYRAGQTVRSATESVLPDRNILNPVVRDVASGVGSLGANLATALTPGVRNVAVPMMLLQGSGEATERAVKAGATPDQINRAASLGTIAGASEFGDLLLMNLGTTGKAAGFLRTMGERFVKGAFIEGGQEGLQQFIQNSIAKGVYKPKQDLTEDVRYNMFIGGIVGGGAGTVLGGREAPSSPIDPATLAEATAPVAPSTQPAMAPTTVAAAPAAVPAAPAPIEAPLPQPPTTAEVEAKQMPPEISAFIEKNAVGLTLPENPQQLTLDNLLGPQGEEIQTKPGANLGRMASMLSQNLYGRPEETAEISVKELFQNAFDGIKTLIQRNALTKGNIDIQMDPDTRKISVTDNGSGMAPDILATKFLEIAGTHKEAKDSSGGFGIAKMQFLYGNKSLNVITARDGKVSTLSSTGQELFDSLKKGTPGPKVQVRSITDADRVMFPNGHGTRVEIVIPESYVDANTKEVKPIDFTPYEFTHPVLQNSPLFANIDVRLNGRVLDKLGSTFPIDKFTQFANINSEWGTARIYISKAPSEGQDWAANVHVLSNGIWQFNSEVKEDISKPYGKNIPYKIYIDVNARAKPEEAGYPFDLNRQGFAGSARQAFSNMFRYMSLVHEQASLAKSAQNFGTMQFLDYDSEMKSVTASENKKIEPKVPPKEDALSLMRPGDSVTVKDGKLIVSGREVPELTPEEVEKFRVNPASLRVDQSEIDPNRVILHDNVVIKVSEMETRNVADYGREKFGRRFDEFTFAIGASFKELRDNVVRIMNRASTPAIQWQTSPEELEQQLAGIPSMLIQKPFVPERPYDALAKEGIGISFDVNYRGVSIKLPFSAMFLNPVVPEYNDPVRAAVGMVGTMVHELAHYKVRDHNAAFPAEMQRILINLDADTEFNFNAFKQKVVNIVAAYEDVFTHLNGVFTTGEFDIQPRGERFKESGSKQARDGGLPQYFTPFGPESESGAELSYWVEKGSTVPSAERGSAGPAYETRRSGNNRPSDNGRGRNYGALKGIDPGITAPPQQPEVNVLREEIAPALGGTLPPEVKEAAAHADRFNWFYKFMAGVTELLDANPNFVPLRKYVERVRLMHNDETQIHDAAMRIAKDWRGLGDRSKNLENLILDVQSMVYLTPGERSLQLWRHPTPDEFKVLTDKNRIDDETLKVYNKIRLLEGKYLNLIERNALEQAQRSIADPVRLAARLDEIRILAELSRTQPFFPFTRFGRHYVLVKDAAGKPIHFETFETKRIGPFRVKSAERLQQQKKEEIQRKLKPGETVEVDMLPETAEPFIGMHPLLLQVIKGAGPIGLTEEQIKSMELLQVMRNPSLALRDRAKRGDLAVPGFSKDLQRSFARYYFFGGRYYAKTKHSWALRSHVGEALLAPGNKATLISSYLADHLQNTVLDARGDFGWFKGAIFLWAMGYVPAAATQNLTQTPMVTFPFLGAKFGDVRASAALVKAMTQVSNFYRRGAYDTMTGFEYSAISYGIKTGRISETQAPELAGIASGNNLVKGYGGTRLEQGAMAFQEKAAWMFEMAEQYNRRVAFRAALELAQKNPKAKFVEESVQKYQDEYKSILASTSNPTGYNENQARAVVAAIAAIDQTQFVYAKYARPRFMRGPLSSTLFVFKRYMQSLLFMLGHNKSDVLPRYLVIAMLLAGLGGAPGYDDFRSLMRAFARWFFGKDVDPDKIVREYVMQWFGKDSMIQPDLVLHGLARRGFGIPAMMDLAGSVFTGKPGRGLRAEPNVNVPYPVFDRSKAITMGNILPVDLGKLLTPTDKLDKTIVDQTQKASGAVFSVGFNIYKALMDSDSPATDLKRWEKAMPRALASASRSYRTFSEGRERGSKGGPNSASTVVLYDVRDTEQMFEILGMAGGYQPLRQQAKWDQIIAKAEITAFYDLRRKGLLEEYYEAFRGKNPAELEKVKAEINQYNRELPEYAKGKVLQPTTIVKSMNMRERNLQARESGTPMQKSNVPIARHIDALYPEATIDVRRRR